MDQSLDVLYGIRDLNIHPFIDGNGRIGRVINNYLLIREGFVPINIKFVDRKTYYTAFQAFDSQGSMSVMEVSDFIFQ